MKSATKTKTTTTAAPKGAGTQTATVPADLAETVARMKEAARAQDPDVGREGKRAGEKWARTEATPRQLCRLARHADGFRSPAESGYDYFTLVAVITNEDTDDVGDDDAREFFESRFGAFAEDDWRDDAFVAAFVAAAVRLWKRVRPHIG